MSQTKTVAICFSGDSGDGMQLAGDRLAKSTAIAGKHLMTLSDFPAEIRAPRGSLAGVSSFRLKVGDGIIFDAGEEVHLLVAMNPAALQANLPRLIKGGCLVVNRDTFTDQNIQRAGFEKDPLPTLQGYQVISAPMTELTRGALAETSLRLIERDRCRNFFALGLCSWLLGCATDFTEAWLDEKFAKNPDLCAGNKLALQKGYHYGDINELALAVKGENAPAQPLTPGEYRYINGNEALLLGLLAASHRSGRELFLGSYPITPASSLLQVAARHRNFNLTTFQAEDEMAAVGACVGASYGGALAVCATSGPGLALKSELLGLAVMAELPLVVIDVQRAGPSTGMPTKMEQSDLNIALHGRHGECPVVVMAADSVGGCFQSAYQAARIAMKAMVPVVLLSDSSLANGAEVFAIPELDALANIEDQSCPSPEGFQPYQRDEKSLARPWVTPGMPNLAHRIGGLEKEDLSGAVSYDPLNHEKMVALRQRKVALAAQDFDPCPSPEQGQWAGFPLVIGWGSTKGAVASAAQNLEQRGVFVNWLSLNLLSPLPRGLDKPMREASCLFVVENNAGQLRRLLQGEYCRRTEGINKIQGVPFTGEEVADQIHAFLERT